MAIITVAARWRAEFVWYAHSRLALRLGVEPAVVEAIGDDRMPNLRQGRAVAVHSVARQLPDHGRLTAEVFDEAIEELGAETLVELVTLCVYYTIVSFVLNAFEAPVPRGVKPHWK